MVSTVIRATPSHIQHDNRGASSVAADQSMILQRVLYVTVDLERSGYVMQHKNQSKYSKLAEGVAGTLATLMHGTVCAIFQGFGRSPGHTRQADLFRGSERNLG